MNRSSSQIRTEVYENQLKQGRLEEAGDFPKVVLIDTVSFCNLRCSMCVHKEMTRKKGIMKWELYAKIIDEISDNNKDIRVWLVFFGDPFVIKRRKPSIFDMISYAKSKGLTNTVLNSNGNLMDIDSARKLIEIGLDAIYFGIDAYTPETYSKLRVGGDHNKTIENVRGLIRLRKEMKSEKPNVVVQFVEMDSNAHEIRDFMSFWNNEGANVKIRPKVSWAGAIDAPNLVLGNEDRWPCHWAMQTMSITDTGKVVTCAVDLDARFIAGDVTKQTLKEVWNGKLKEVRQLHISKRFKELPPNCRDCRDWQSARADYYSLNP